MWEQNQIKRTLSRSANVARVQALMRAAPELHRTALADQICTTWGFFDARGRPQRAGCLKALRALERAGQITLPVARSTPGRGSHGRRLGEAVPAPQGVGREVTDLVGLELVRVDDAEHRALWNELMAREHPRGMGPLVGARRCGIWWVRRMAGWGRWVLRRRRCSWPPAMPGSDGTRRCGNATGTVWWG